MIQSKEDYLYELSNLLPSSLHIHKQEILREFEIHLELEMKNGKTIDEIIHELGDPLLIAQQFQENTTTPRKTTLKTFIGVNLFLFFAGSLFTIGNHLFETSIIGSAWGLVTKFPLMIILLYSVFWILLGFEIGMEYGYGGKQIFTKTVFCSLIPNFVLMVATLFKIISVNWFEPLLTPSFIVVCICGTLLFYPVSKLGYKMGVYRSI